MESADVSISFTTQQWKVLTSAYHLPHNNGKCWRQHIIYHTTMENADVIISFTTQQWKVLTSSYNLLYNNGKCWRHHIIYHTIMESADVSIILTTQWWKVLSISFVSPGVVARRARACVRACVRVCVWCPENVKFLNELFFLLWIWLHKSFI